MNGKGDSPRNCFSEAFRDNYDEIQWGSKAPGRMTEAVKRLLADWPAIPAIRCRCSEHDRWFVQIDPLAPYHWELSKCSECLKQEKGTK